MSEDLTPHEGLGNDCGVFFLLYQLLLISAWKSQRHVQPLHSLSLHLCSSWLSGFFLSSSPSHPLPCCAYETWLISVRNLPYITRVGAHSCKSHDQYVGTAIMKMDGRADRADRIPQAFPTITLISHSNKCLCGLYKLIFQFQNVHPGMILSLFLIRSVIEVIKFFVAYW